nr:MAG TPA: replisome organizer [Caudoviricetes sp.]
MRKITWFKVDDGFYDHPKFIDLPNAAIGLWAKCGAWCGKHLTDGVIPASQVKRFKGTPAQIKALVSERIWVEERDESGAKVYRFHGWNEYQPTREQKLKEREDGAERQRKSRRRRAAHEEITGHFESESGAKASHFQHESDSTMDRNAPQTRHNYESSLSANTTQSAFKSNPPKSDYQQEQENVTRDSHVTGQRDIAVSHRTVSHRPDPTRPDPSYVGTSSQPSNGEYGDGQELAGPTLNDLADATRRARQAGISDTAITAGTRRFNERPEPKGPGLLRTLINDEWEAEQLKTRIETDRRHKRAAIANCTLCDENGMRDTGNGLTRCNHRLEAPQTGQQDKNGHTPTNNKPTPQNGTGGPY